MIQGGECCEFKGICFFNVCLEKAQTRAAFQSVFAKSSHAPCFAPIIRLPLACPTTHGGGSQTQDHHNKSVDVLPTHTFKCVRRRGASGLGRWHQVQ
jgi:hypothetical protein